MNDDHTVFVLGLLQLPKVGKTTAIAIMKESRHVTTSPEGFEEALQSLTAMVPRLKTVDLSAAPTALAAAARIREACQAAGISIHTWRCDSYPPKLRSIPDPPAIVFTKGAAPSMDLRRSAAIIGTRSPTDFGVEMGRQFAGHCAERGIAVVSGLAIGCDAAAHEGALDQHGFTVAVLAHGLDIVHPRRHADLAGRILDTGGTLLSEYPVGTPVIPRQFVERDRLQSGLADALIVIETDVEGGTMHTVKSAEKQKRAIACLQHPEDLRTEPKTQGNRVLIEEGRATPISSVEDLDRFLATIPTESPPPAPPDSAEPPCSPGLFEGLS